MAVARPTEPIEITFLIEDQPYHATMTRGDIVHLGIHKALRYLFANPARGHEWIRKPNLAFGGRSALDRMLAGAPSDIAAVRAYLDAERSGW